MRNGARCKDDRVLLSKLMSSSLWSLGNARKTTGFLWLLIRSLIKKVWLQFIRYIILVSAYRYWMYGRTSGPYLCIPLGQGNDLNFAYGDISTLYSDSVVQVYCAHRGSDLLQVHKITIYILSQIHISKVRCGKCVMPASSSMIVKIKESN